MIDPCEKCEDRATCKNAIEVREVTMMIPENEIQKVIDPLKEKNITFAMKKSLQIVKLMGLNPDPMELRMSKMSFLHSKIMDDDKIRKAFIELSTSIALSIVVDDPEFNLGDDEQITVKETAYDDMKNELQDLIKKLVTKKGAN